MTTQNGFQLRLNQCTGCQACLLACSIENDLSPGDSWRNVVTFNEHQRPELPVIHLSLACHHCDDPACLRGCPALAYRKDSETGAVTIDEQKCIGCKYCSWMCPYGAPQFNVRQGVMQKCTFCNDRLHSGLQPACVDYCPTGALGFREIEVRDRRYDVPGLPNTELRPALEIEGIDGFSLPLPSTVKANISPTMTSSHHTAVGCTKISVRGEWTLLLFTIMAAVIVAWFTSSTFGGTPLHLPTYMILGFGAMAISMVHLGQRSRAYRAVLNLRRSWLSREVFFWTVFFGGSTLILLFEDLGIFDFPVPAAAVFISLIGAASLFSMDMVYVVAATTHSVRWHSASVLLTGLFLAGLLAGWAWLALAMGACKLFLYATRKYQLTGQRTRDSLPENWQLLVSSIRIGIGMLLPMAIWMAGGAAMPILICCVVGEIVDRGEFYEELEIISPATQMDRDLRAAISK